MLADIFWSLACKGLAEKTHHFTLLDGEMIIDTLPDSRKQERRYLIYDLMAVNSISVNEVWFMSHLKLMLMILFCGEENLCGLKDNEIALKLILIPSFSY